LGHGPTILQRPLAMSSDLCTQVVPVMFRLAGLLDRPAKRSLAVSGRAGLKPAPPGFEIVVSLGPSALHHIERAVEVDLCRGSVCLGYRDLISGLGEVGGHGTRCTAAKRFDGGGLRLRGVGAGHSYLSVFVRGGSV